jgi:hypothetical protein
MYKYRVFVHARNKMYCTVCEEHSLECVMVLTQHTVTEDRKICT